MITLTLVQMKGDSRALLSHIMSFQDKKVRKRVFTVIEKRVNLSPAGYYMPLLMPTAKWVASPCQQRCHSSHSDVINLVIIDEQSGHMGCYPSPSLRTE